MMLVGFAGLGYVGYRRAREPRAAVSGALASPYAARLATLAIVARLQPVAA
jgi:hypothetical protein